MFGCAIHDGPQTLNRVDRSGVTTRRPKREIKVRGADPRAAVVARSHATDPRLGPSVWRLTDLACAAAHHPRKGGITIPWTAPYADSWPLGPARPAWSRQPSTIAMKAKIPSQAPTMLPLLMFVSSFFIAGNVVHHAENR